MKNNSFATSYKNFASDHHSIAVRIASSNNQFTSKFKQFVSFDKDFHTKKKAKKRGIDSVGNIYSDEASKSKLSKDGHDSEGEAMESAEFDQLNTAFVHEELEDREKEMINLSDSNDGGSSTSQLKILFLSNPIRDNLCFSNSVVSMMLNLRVFISLLSEKSEEMTLHIKRNEIFKELVNLNNLENYSKASSHKLRSVVHQSCRNSGEVRPFDDKKQHDAGEFLSSIFEHMFKDLSSAYAIDERIFGGLYQERLECVCGYVNEHPIQKLSEILMIQISGVSIQACIDNFLEDEEISAVCPDCHRQTLMKSMNIITKPSTLIIQLKRYDFDSREQRPIKRTDKIEFSKQIRVANTSYTISSILNHFGDSPEDGHYNIVIYDESNGSFLLVDDLYVNSEVKMTTDLKSASYIFVFNKDVKTY